MQKSQSGIGVFLSRHLCLIGAIEGDPASPLIVKEPWYVDELALTLSPRPHLLKWRELTLREVLQEPDLLQTPGIKPTFVERILAARGITIAKPVTVESREAVKAAIAPGLRCFDHA